MSKTTELECDWCGSLCVGTTNPKDFWRQVCPKPGSCTATIVSRYVPDEASVATVEAAPRDAAASTNL